VSTKTLIAIWLISLLFSAVAWADGAPPPDPIPPPKYSESPLVKGEFTVSYEPFEEGDTPKFFIIHVVLEGNRPYVLRRPVTDKSLDNICEYQDLSMSILIDKYGTEPRDHKVQKDFGFEGTPIISEIKLKGYNCNDKKKAMLKGQLKIRVLPPEFFDRD